jgi:hypothetical protein
MLGCQILILDKQSCSSIKKGESFNKGMAAQQVRLSDGDEEEF